MLDRRNGLDPAYQLANIFFTFGFDHSNAEFQMHVGPQQPYGSVECGPIVCFNICCMVSHLFRVQNGETTLRPLPDWAARDCNVRCAATGVFF